MYAGLFFNLKQGFRERCRRWGKSCSPSLPPHGSAGAEGSETLGVDRNLLSVFCCLFWGDQSWARAGAGAADAQRHSGSAGSGLRASHPSECRGAPDALSRCRFPSGKKVLVRLALSSAEPWFE